MLPLVPCLGAALEWELVFCILNGGMTCGLERPGLGGTLFEGEGASTIHIRCDLVAQSFATAWARVLKGVTWKTG